GTESQPFIRLRRQQTNGYLQLPRGIPYWNNDKQAQILRLGYIKPEVLSWSPRIILLHNFLSLEGSSPPSPENFNSGGCKDRKDHARSILPLNLNPMVNISLYHLIPLESRVMSEQALAIEKRISVYSQVPVENGELMQVLRYEKNQYYRPHHDYFSDTFNLKRGGQRIATMLMYLGDNVEGGETHFPSAGSDECSCGGKLTKGLCVKPIKGNAVLFWSMGLDGQSDPDSVHGGCPVLAGEKWSATKWMRQSVHV
ncbi:prolyl 4-hydroxylase subunit alpha-1-like protein, partial [Trifolium pratense]